MKTEELIHLIASRPGDAIIHLKQKVEEAHEDLALAQTRHAAAASCLQVAYTVQSRLRANQREIESLSAELSNLSRTGEPIDLAKVLLITNTI